MITTGSILTGITTGIVLRGATMMTIITLMMMVGLNVPTGVSVDMTIKFQQ